MSAISNIRHRHLLFRYRRQICRTEKRHSDIGSVPISTSEFIPISDIEEKKNFILQIRTREHCEASTITLSYCDSLWRIVCQISDIGQNFIPISDIMSDSALSVWYRKFRYQAQSNIADHGYRTKCPPMIDWYHFLSYLYYWTVPLKLVLKCHTVLF